MSTPTDLNLRIAEILEAKPTEPPERGKNIKIHGYFRSPKEEWYFDKVQGWKPLREYDSEPAACLMLMERATFLGLMRSREGVYTATFSSCHVVTADDKDLKRAVAMAYLKCREHPHEPHPQAAEGANINTSPATRPQEQGKE